MKNSFFTILFFTIIFSACSTKKGDVKDEQIIAVTNSNDATADSLSNSINDNVAISQIPTLPNNVILTGLVNHRLVSVHKQHQPSNTNIVDDVRQKVSSTWECTGSDNDAYSHFMPGIDILYGYKLLNISHYNFLTEKQHLFFNKPVLIKTLYYPSYEQDSINKIPINRNYYLVSVYDEDTNKDTLLNRKDLRHFYLFDETASIKTDLLPANYSVIRSQYDYGKDLMYLFVKFDTNKNGLIEKTEPLHIFWIDLKNPQKAKRLY